jgi:hypothetical protein
MPGFDEQFTRNQRRQDPKCAYLQHKLQGKCLFGRQELNGCYGTLSPLTISSSGVQLYQGRIKVDSHLSVTCQFRISAVRTERRICVNGSA